MLVFITARYKVTTFIIKSTWMWKNTINQQQHPLTLNACKYIQPEKHNHLTHLRLKFTLQVLMLRSDCFVLLFTLSFKCDCHQSHVWTVSGSHVSGLQLRPVSQQKQRAKRLCFTPLTDGQTDSSSDLCLNSSSERSVCVLLRWQRDRRTPAQTCVSTEAASEASVFYSADRETDGLQLRPVSQQKQRAKRLCFTPLTERQTDSSSDLCLNRSSERSVCVLLRWQRDRRTPAQTCVSTEAASEASVFYSADRRTDGLQLRPVSQQQQRAKRLCFTPLTDGQTDSSSDLCLNRSSEWSVCVLLRWQTDRRTPAQTCVSTEAASEASVFYSADRETDGLQLRPVSQQKQRAKRLCFTPLTERQTDFSSDLCLNRSSERSVCVLLRWQRDRRTPAQTCVSTEAASEASVFYSADRETDGLQLRPVSQQKQRAKRLCFTPLTERQTDSSSDLCLNRSSERSVCVLLRWQRDRRTPAQTCVSTEAASEASVFYSADRETDGLQLRPVSQQKQRAKRLCFTPLTERQTDSSSDLCLNRSSERSVCVLLRWQRDRRTPAQTCVSTEAASEASVFYSADRETDGLQLRPVSQQKQRAKRLCFTPLTDGQTDSSSDLCLNRSSERSVCVLLRWQRDRRTPAQTCVSTEAASEASVFYSADRETDGLQLRPVSQQKQRAKRLCFTPLTDGQTVSSSDLCLNRSSEFTPLTERQTDSSSDLCLNRSSERSVCVLLRWQRDRRTPAQTCVSTEAASEASVFYSADRETDGLQLRPVSQQKQRAKRLCFTPLTERQTDSSSDLCLNRSSERSVCVLLRWQTDSSSDLCLNRSSERSVCVLLRWQRDRRTPAQTCVSTEAASEASVFYSADRRTDGLQLRPVSQQKQQVKRLCFTPLTDGQTDSSSDLCLNRSSERLGFTGTCQELLSVDEGACVWMMMDGGRHIKTYLNSSVKAETWDQRDGKAIMSRSLALPANVNLLQFLFGLFHIGRTTYWTITIQA